MSKESDRRNTVSKIHRGFTILKNYGLGSSRMESGLALYTLLLRKFGCNGSFPVTASLVHQHRNLLGKLTDNGIELAIHGYTHVDFSQLSYEDQLGQIEKAKQAFQDSQLPFSGFRSPYLRWNSDTAKAIGEAGFLYSSNRSLFWNALESVDLRQDQLASYNRVIQFYGAQQADECPSLPELLGGTVDIPVSLPDDEMLVERLKLIDGERIGNIWRAILDMSYEYGELFTLQLHPERIRVCYPALESLLQLAVSMKPGVWIARLSEVAEWWRKKAKFAVKVETLNETSSYMVEIDCSDDASVLARNLKVHCNSQDWVDGYKLVNTRRFQVKSSARPFIGVSTQCSDDFVSLLENSGYMVEKSDSRSDYGIYLDETVQSKREREVIEIVENSHAPILKFWRWPHANKSALCITGDIDSITLWDFISRKWK